MTDPYDDLEELRTVLESKGRTLHDFGGDMNVVPVPKEPGEVSHVLIGIETRDTGYVQFIEIVALGKGID